MILFFIHIFIDKYLYYYIEYSYETLNRFLFKNKYYIQ